MKNKKYFVLNALLFAINMNAHFYKSTITIHPIAQECNKNAKKIKALMKHYNIHPMRPHKPDTLMYPKEQAQYQFIIISSVVVLENFNQGNPIFGAQIITTSC